MSSCTAAAPRGSTASNSGQAVLAAASLGDSVVIKAQLLAGGRGKAGLVRTAEGRRDVEGSATAILEASFGGRRVDRVLVEEKLPDTM